MAEGQMQGGSSAEFNTGGIDLGGKIGGIREQLRALGEEVKRAVGNVAQLRKGLDLDAARAARFKHLARLFREIGARANEAKINAEKLGGAAGKEIKSMTVYVDRASRAWRAFNAELSRTRKLLTDNTMSGGWRAGGGRGGGGSRFNFSDAIDAEFRDVTPRSRRSGFWGGFGAAFGGGRGGRGGPPPDMHPGTGSPKGGWQAKAKQQAIYWGRLHLMFAGLRKVEAGFQEYADLQGDTMRAVRTSADNVTNYVSALTAQRDIQRELIRYGTQHLLITRNYTDAIYQLTSAEMKRGEALKIAPAILAAGTALGPEADVNSLSRLVVGLNKIYKDIPGFGSDSERINRMLAVITQSVKQEVVEVNELTTALGYVAPVAKEANLSFEELIGTLGFLNTQMISGSRAGTGLRQVLNALSKAAPALRNLGLNIDQTKPLNLLETLRQLSELTKGGGLPASLLHDLFAAFNLRGAPSAAILAQNFDAWATGIEKLKNADSGTLYAMRDVMEMTTPAQFHIFAKNVDRLVAAFLQGRDASLRMASGLKAINAAMVPLIPTVRQLSGVAAPLLAIAGATIAGGALYRHAPGASSMMQLLTLGLGARASAWAPGVTSARGSMGLALGRALPGMALAAAIGGAYLYNRRQENAAGAISTGSQSMADYLRRAQTLRATGASVGAEQPTYRRLADINRDLANSATDMGVAVLRAARSAREAAAQYEQLAQHAEAFAKAAAGQVLQGANTRLADGFFGNIMNMFSPDSQLGVANTSNFWKLKYISPLLGFAVKLFGGSVENFANIKPLQGRDVNSSLTQFGEISDILQAAAKAMHTLGFGKGQAGQTIADWLFETTTAYKEQVAILNQKGKLDLQEIMRRQALNAQLKYFTELIANPYAARDSARAAAQGHLGALSLDAQAKAYQLSAGPLGDYFGGRTIERRGQKRVLRGAAFGRAQLYTDALDLRRRQYLDRIKRETGIADIYSGIANMADASPADRERYLNAVNFGLGNAERAGSISNAERARIAKLYTGRIAGNAQAREQGIFSYINSEFPSARGILATKHGRDLWTGEQSDQQKLIEQLQKLTQSITTLNQQIVALAPATADTPVGALMRKRADQSAAAADWQAGVKAALFNSLPVEKAHQSATEALQQMTTSQVNFANAIYNTTTRTTIQLKDLTKRVDALDKGRQ